MNNILDSILETYLQAYRDLIAVEQVDPSSITISFPLHLAGNHRVEVTVTDIGNGRCIISDGSRTLNEVRSAGHSLSSQMKEKLGRIANLSDVAIVEDTLILEISYVDVGVSIQRFLEMSKMIGDVYLVHKPREASTDDLVAEVKTALDAKAPKSARSYDVDGGR